jgi:hypothetical protein
MPTTDQSEALTTARIEITRLEVTVAHLSVSFDGLQKSHEQLALKLDQVIETLAQARGGWRTLMVVGGAASAATAALSWIIQHMPKGV